MSDLIGGHEKNSPRARLFKAQDFLLERGPGDAYPMKRRSLLWAEAGVLSPYPASFTLGGGFFVQPFKLLFSGTTSKKGGAKENFS
jgi:hypothetical protein